MSTATEPAKTYRKCRIGVYPVGHTWSYNVVTPGNGSVSDGGFFTEASARAAARRQARFHDRLERDRVDGVETQRTGRVIEKGIRLCTKCGEPHDLVATTRRGRRWGQTWEKPGCGTYHAEPWEAVARRAIASGQDGGRNA